MTERPKILIIEDEPAIADTLTYALQTEGMEPLWARTGGEGLALFEAQSPALVILDLGLPDTDGFALCREIRARSAVPVIILSARSEEVDRVVGLELGADDYVVKPFSPRELSARVKANLRRVDMGGVPGEEPVKAVAGFEVDEAVCDVRYAGRALNLSRYEFRLLKLLISRPRRVYAREQLMDLVWEEPERSMERTVDTHIKTLRAKIREAGGDTNHIRTHRGLGYAFNPEPGKPG